MLPCSGLNTWDVSHADGSYFAQQESFFMSFLKPCGASSCPSRRSASRSRSSMPSEELYGPPVVKRKVLTLWDPTRSVSYGADRRPSGAPSNTQSLASAARRPQLASGGSGKPEWRRAKAGLHIGNATGCRGGADDPGELAVDGTDYISRVGPDVIAAKLRLSMHNEGVGDAI